MALLKSKRNSTGKTEARRDPVKGLAPGFTLLEVMVSVAILGIGIVMVIQLFSGGLGLAASVRDYTDTVLFAKETMAVVLVEDELSEGVTSGVSPEGFEWKIEATPVGRIRQSWLNESRTNAGSKLWDLSVEVYNPYTRRRFTLSSVIYEGENFKTKGRLP